MEICVGIESLTWHELLALPFQLACACRGVECYKTVCKEEDAAEIRELLADIHTLPLEVWDAVVCGLLRRGGKGEQSGEAYRCR